MKLNLSLRSVALLIACSASAQASALFDNYNFDTASQAHSQAQALSPQSAQALVGNYKMIATASRSYRGDFAKKDLNGIANADQSVLGLQIAQQSVGNLVQVIQTNLQVAGQNQGPAVAIFSPAGALTFTQYSYKNGELSAVVYFVSECKLLQDQALLCSKRFWVQDVSQVNTQQAAMNNTIVGYDLYTR